MAEEEDYERLARQQEYWDDRYAREAVIQTLQTSEETCLRLQGTLTKTLSSLTDLNPEHFFLVGFQASSIADSVQRTIAKLVQLLGEDEWAAESAQDLIAAPLRVLDGHQGAQPTLQALEEACARLAAVQSGLRLALQRRNDDDESLA